MVLKIPIHIIKIFMVREIKKNKSPTIAPITFAFILFIDNFLLSISSGDITKTNETIPQYNLWSGKARCSEYVRTTPIIHLNIYIKNFVSNKNFKRLVFIY